MTQKKPTPSGEIHCSAPGCKSTFLPRFRGQRYGKCTPCCEFYAQLNAARRSRRPVSDADREIGERIERMTHRVHAH